VCVVCVCVCVCVVCVCVSLLPCQENLLEERLRNDLFCVKWDAETLLVTGVV